MRGKKLAALVGVALAVAVSGCGGESSEREYALPETFCGFEVPPNLYEPLFPAGKELTVGGEFSHDLASLLSDTCSYRVDGEPVVVSDGSPAELFEHYLRDEELSQSLDDGRQVEGRFDAQVWPDLGLVRVPCVVPSGSSSFIETLTLGVRAPAIDGDDQRRILGELVQSYMTAVAEFLPCEESGG
ncbi:hypothetical protein [Streptomyces sp. RFCAC02]|uniref:hypothetical protein n=1 Tax=Streptomyces sp. RFCAC02 TaxID=2499143 RepID=UPI001021A3A4|nr:hypothetical protein [Streptomyces sp. RFCAC02]